MDKTKLREALEFAKENGLRSIEVDGIKIDLLQMAPMPEESTVEVKDIIADITQEFTDEEIAYYHTEYFDELQAKKKQHQESLKISEDLKNG